MQFGFSLTNARTSMTEGQKLLRKVRWRHRAVFVGSIAFAFLCTWAGTIVLDRPLSLRMLLSISIMAGIALHFVYLFGSSCWIRKQVPNTTEIVSLSQFYSNPNAIIAPNFQGLSTDIQRWLMKFSSVHGPNSVFVSRELDELHISDTVFLITPRLSKQEEQTLVDLHADSIGALSHSKGRKLFPDVSPPTRVFRVLWD
jgi:hypothetical protein